MQLEPRSDADKYLVNVSVHHVRLWYFLNRLHPSVKSDFLPSVFLLTAASALRTLLFATLCSASI